MKIKITQDHITNGKRLNGESCPIALALIDAGFCNIDVRVGRVFLGSAIIPLPTVARAFMGQFDRGYTVIPFEFEFDYKNPLSVWARIKLGFNTPSVWTSYVRGIR